MRDFSKLKVLGITLLVTMSSCVVGSIDLNAESLRAYGFEFDISTIDKTQSVQKSKKSKLYPNTKFRFINIIESGREHISFPNISLDHSQFILHLKEKQFQCPLINRISIQRSYIYSQLYHGINQLNRAGPCTPLANKVLL